MKIVVRALGHSHLELGFRELDVSLQDGCVSIRKLIELLLREAPRLRLVFSSEYVPTPRFLVFVNRVDVRIYLLSNALVCGDTSIDIVPVIHHG